MITETPKPTNLNEAYKLSYKTGIISMINLFVNQNIKTQRLDTWNLQRKGGQFQEI